MKRTAFLYVLMFLIVAPLFGQTSAITGYCVLGAKQAITSGLNSTNYLQGVIPQCTVTVYLTGTTTLATIYADSSSTPLTNPFTANTDGSWLFYPATSQGYDVALSGGVSPNTYPSPVTLTDVFPGSDITVSSVTFQTNGTDNAVQSKLNLKSGTNTTVVSDSAGGVTINSTGGTDAAAVHYNPTTATYFMISDSRLIEPETTATTATSVSCDGTTCTFTGSNTIVAGDFVQPRWSFVPTCMQGAEGAVQTATSTQFTMLESSTQCTGTQTGTGGDVSIMNSTVPYLTQQEPFFNGHGKVQLLTQPSYGGGTVYDWDTQFSTLLSPKLTACLATAGPCYLVVSLGFDDLFASSPDSCSTVGTLEGSVTTTGSFRKLFNEVHQLGNVKIITATEPTRMSSSVYCTSTPQDAIIVNQWLVTLSGAGAETSGYLDYADSIIDTATAMGSPSNANFSDGVHYSSGGAQVFADALNNGMSSQGSWNLGQPASNGPNALIGSQLISDPVGSYTGCQLSFAINGSTTGDFCLQDYVGIGALQVAGNWASSWRWDSANSVMRQQMPSNGGYCIQDGTYNPYGSNSDTCLWRDSANVWDLGNGTWKNSSGTLHLTNILGQSTAPSGSCTVNGDWQFTQDGAITKCVSGTWTTFSGGSGSMIWPTYTGIAKYSGSSSWVTPTYTDVTKLWAGGSCTGYLYSDGTCSTSTSSPLTTKGDLYGYGTTNARIPVGTDGYVLTVDSTQALGVRWAAGGGSTDANLSNAVYVSPRCSSGDSNCYQVYDDVQVATAASYTTSISGGTSATLVTTYDNDSGAQYANIPSYGYPQTVTFGTSASLQYAQISVALKSTGSGGIIGSCWGGNEDSASAATITLSVSPVGGAGHYLLLLSRSQSNVSYTVTDSSNTWMNALSSSVYNSGNMSAQLSYAANIASGTYTVTSTLSSASAYRSIFACEVSGLATSSALDGQAGSSTGSGTLLASIISPTQAEDFVFNVATIAGTSSTFTSGTVGGTVAVTTASTDPVFTNSDVGKKIVATTDCDSANGYVNCYQSFSDGVIAGYVNAHSITVSAAPLLASTGTTFTGWFLWGHDDGGTIASAWSAALSRPNMSLILPCGTMFIGQAPFISTSTGAVYNPQIAGCAGPNGTVLVPTAGFIPGSNAYIYSYPATNELNTALGATYQNPFYWSAIRDLTIWGAGLPGTSNTIALPMFLAYIAKMQNVHVTGWLWNANVEIPVIDAYTVDLDNVDGWGAGTDGLVIEGDQYPSNITSIAKNFFFGAQGTTNLPQKAGYGLYLKGGNLVAIGGQFNPYAQGKGNTDSGAGIYQTGGHIRLIGTQFGHLYTTSGITYLSDAQDSLLGGWGIHVAGGYVYSTASQIDGLTMSSGSFSDIGGNYACNSLPAWVACDGQTTAWTNNPHASISITGGRLIGSASAGGAAADAGLATSEVALTSGWGSATVSSASGDSHFGRFVITESGSPTASPVVTLTFPTEYALAPSGCQIQQTAGNFTLSNPVTGAPSTTSVTFTWSGTPIASDTYTFVYRCGP